MNEVLYRAVNDIDWITIIICCSLGAIITAKSFFYSRFTNFIILPFNNKYIFMYNKKDKLSHWFTIFLSIFQILNFALFIYYIDAFFGISHQAKSPLLYFGILAFAFVFFLLKITLYLGNAFVFNISEVITEFLFKKISYFNYSGFVMFFANILLTYVLIDSEAVIYLSLFLILVINIMGWLTIIRNYQKIITSNIFYFILYLCALEITPLVLLGDYFNN